MALVPFSVSESKRFFTTVEEEDLTFTSPNCFGRPVVVSRCVYGMSGRLAFSRNPPFVLSAPFRSETQLPRLLGSRSASRIDEIHTLVGAGGGGDGGAMDAANILKWPGGGLGWSGVG